MPKRKPTKPKRKTSPQRQARASKKTISPPKPLLLVQLSDTHLFADPSQLQHQWCNQASFDAVLADVRTQVTDAVLATGDLVQDESALGYARLATALHKLKLPVYYLPGNHDDPQRLHTAFAPLGEAAPARVLLGGWQLLLLDDHLPGQAAGEIPQAQLDQLAYWLVHHPEPALIALHHPPVSVGSRWLDALGLRNGPTLLKLAALHPQVRAIVCGHVHQALDMGVNGVRILAAPSTCRQFLPHSEHFAEDPAAFPGYRRLWLHADGRLHTDVVRVPAARLAGFQSLPQESHLTYRHD